MVRNVFAIFLFCALNGRAQGIEFKNISRLPSVVNSSAEEIMPLLSPDGKTLYFARAMSPDNEGGAFAGLDIWTTDLSFKKTTNRLPQNNKGHNAVIGISKDNKILYLLEASPSQRMNGIYFSGKSAGKHERPELIPIPGIANLDFIGFYVSPDFDVIFLSMKAPDSRGEEDLYYSVKDVSGSWSIPRNLGATINTSGFELSPFLSADKKRLYFASNGHGGEGDADIFYSERLYDSWETWSAPVNLGKAINSKKFDAYFSLYGDTIAFFSSNREGRYGDLYKANVIQSKTILRKGQHYLTASEWDATLGKNVSGKITFPHNSDFLAPAQKELIFYIVNKVMLDHDIEFHVVVREEEDQKLSKLRMAEISNHLKKLGIDQSRIHEDQIFPVERTQRGVVEMILLR